MTTQANDITISSSPGKFYFSEPGSDPPTRESSPSPSDEFHIKNHQIYDEADEPIQEKVPEIDIEASPGLLSDEVYESTMAWWRADIRRVLVRNLKTESRWLAVVQSKTRNSWLDAYFVYASALGTHTFFMLLLPALYFFGYDRIGLGLVTVSGMGVYWSGFVKDLICSPRPFAPPVTRLTLGTHHLEYGFPSTHSTNSASVALYIHSLIYRLYVSSAISSTALHVWQAVLIWYALSVVLGRLYCGMHSFTDCAVGAGIGSAVWATYWMYEDFIEIWLSTSGWSLPVTLGILATIMINQHPQPIDDCPCFEDSIAFISSIMGVMLGKWHAIYFGLEKPSSRQLTNWEGQGWSHWTIWLALAGVKLFIGIIIIFIWRLFAKAFFHAVLPPTFRFIGNIFTLPHRRFYTPATDYEHMPTEKGLHPIPSVIDLPQSPTVMTQTSASLPHVHGEGLKLRNGGLKFPGRETTNAVVENPGNGVRPGREGGRKHYDADVLTKVMVYVGIGMIASEWGPLLFEILGLGAI